MSLIYIILLVSYYILIISRYYLYNLLFWWSFFSSMEVLTLQLEQASTTTPSICLQFMPPGSHGAVFEQGKSTNIWGPHGQRFRTTENALKAQLQCTLIRSIISRKATGVVLLETCEGDTPLVAHCWTRSKNTVRRSKSAIAAFGKPAIDLNLGCPQACERKASMVHFCWKSQSKLPSGASLCKAKRKQHRYLPFLQIRLETRSKKLRYAQTHNGSRRETSAVHCRTR